MIKLIATDIDDTLLVEGTNELNPELYQVIKELKKKGMRFAAASGRQYSSIRRLFEPVIDDVICVAENGSYVVYRDVPMQQVIMNREQAENLIRCIRRMEGCELTVAAFDMMYVETKDEQFIDWLVNGYRNDIKVVEDVLAQKIQINKISIYKRSGVKDIADQVIGQWKDVFKSVVAGAVWIDFMDYRADKGIALQMLQRQLHVDREETMAFGDNSNDLGMLAAAGESYAIGNAQPQVKAAAKYIADTNVNDGVLKEMKKLLALTKKEC